MGKKYNTENETMLIKKLTCREPDGQSSSGEKRIDDPPLTSDENRPFLCLKILSGRTGSGATKASTPMKAEENSANTMSGPHTRGFAHSRESLFLYERPKRRPPRERTRHREPK